MIGFPGDEHMWRQEYNALCFDNGWNTKLGLDLAAFVWLTTNPDDQYWFDASKLAIGGWSAAAGEPELDEGLDAELPAEVAGPGGKAREMEVPMKTRQMEVPMKARQMEVPMQAAIKGLDWAKLEANKDLKAKVVERICAEIAQKTGVKASDLQVTLNPGPARTS